jgi:hypothetical protein
LVAGLLNVRNASKLKWLWAWIWFSFANQAIIAACWVCRYFMFAGYGGQYGLYLDAIGLAAEVLYASIACAVPLIVLMLLINRRRLVSPQSPR